MANHSSVLAWRIPWRGAWRAAVHRAAKSQTWWKYSGVLLKVFTHFLNAMFLLLLNCKYYLFILDTKPIWYVLQIYFSLCVMFFYVFIMMPFEVYIFWLSVIPIVYMSNYGQVWYFLDHWIFRLSFEVIKHTLYILLYSPRLFWLSWFLSIYFSWLVCQFL